MHSNFVTLETGTNRLPPLRKQMTTDHDFEFTSVTPEPSLEDYVDSFWMLHNKSDKPKEVIILPDGRMDLFCSRSATEPFHITLSGIETQADQAILAPGTLMFAISFKLLAAEYIFHQAISDIVDYAVHLPADFWGFGAGDLEDFPLFCQKATAQIRSLIPATVDNRKQLLFGLLYAHKGSITVKELSEKVFWSSRQINRYFNQQFGLSLKTYGDILRFRASFPHIKTGKLFPEQDFADQSHFIKAVKKLAGVSPKELSKNQNGRFIQFSTLGSR